MAELTIHLRIDPQTRKKDVIIIYHSDDDALPLEHEDEHQAIVDKLIEGGALSAAELGRIVVERDPSADERRELSAAEELAQREAIDQGS
ncbi:MAG: hypothetical protein CSA65_00480 [Proteobacteria bacterium]|nr:MAG: hypothetical protein CSB49_00040 [Pseudomonadota bacterium]PIE19953.1 MAG: hypothetical protein CSA65_00480 [Pseudomonadota bacterium]